MEKTKSYEIDMCHGPLFQKILLFTLPLMLSGILQLLFNAAAGVINVILNLVFVINFHMGVAGVAFATIISQCVSALLILQCLMRSEGCIRVEWSKLHIHWGKLGKIAQIGLPAGV